MNLKVYYFKFESEDILGISKEIRDDESTPSAVFQKFYIRDHVWVVLAKDNDHAERLFLQHLKKKDYALSDSAYSIHRIPQRPEVTEVW